jgi:hypothetical protein
MSEVAVASEYNLAGASALAEVWREEGGPDFQPDFPRIKVPAGGGTTWEDRDDPTFQPTRELRGVIVGHRPSTQLYLEKFEDSDEGGRRPDAWSNDGVVQVVPQETYEKIAALNAANGWSLPFPSRNLAECPYNKFPKDGGVVIPGRNTDTPVNSSYRELFMVLHGSPAPIPYLVRLSAASIPAWEGRGKGYKGRLLTRGIRLASVETILTLTPEQGPGNVIYSKVEFHPGRPLEPALLAQTTEFAAGLKPVISSDPFAISRGVAQPAELAAPAAPLAALPVGQPVPVAAVGAPVPVAAPVAAPVAQPAPVYADVEAAIPAAPAPAAPAQVVAPISPQAAELDQAFANAVGSPDPGVQNLADTFGATVVAPAPVAAAPAPVAPAPAPVAQVAPAPAPVAAAPAPAPVAAPAPAPVAAVAPAPVPAQEPVAAAPVAAPAPVAQPVAAAVGSGAATEDDIDF